LFVLDWRLAVSRARDFAADARSHALVPGALRTPRLAVVRETISSLTAQIAESVSGMAVIQAFNRERAFLDEFDRANDANRQTNTHAQWLNSLFFPESSSSHRCDGSRALVGGQMLTHGHSRSGRSSLRSFS